MQIFVARLNIEHFRGRLAAETVPKTLEIIRRLLVAEEAKLAGLLGQATRPSRPTTADGSLEHRPA
jgi:hypothetical protein